MCRVTSRYGDKDKLTIERPRIIEHQKKTFYISRLALPPKVGARSVSTYVKGRSTFEET
jgi:hypothetical protein